MGQMGMFIIGRFCIVFYSVLIILSVFQNEWCSGELEGVGARRGRWDDGSRRLLATTSFVWRGGTPHSTAARSLSSCAAGLCRPLYNNITSTNGGGDGLGSGRSKTCLTSGAWGIGGRCQICVLSVWRRSSY